MASTTFRDKMMNRRMTDNDDDTYIEKQQRKKRNVIIVWCSGIFLYLVLSYFVFHIVKAGQDTLRLSFSEIVSLGLKNSVTIPLNIFPFPEGYFPLYLAISAIFLVACIIVHHERAIKKHDDSETVNGTARLMDEKDLRSYNIRRSDPVGKPENDGPSNMILSRDIFLAMDGRKTRRNCNILVIGGSGAGKSRFFAGPNILNYNSNLVVTDPSGELLRDYGKALENNGYAVKVFNLTDVYKSNRYNPFHYIREEKDVFVLVNTLIKNTTPSEGHAGDPFWEKCEKLLLQALILYLWHMYPEDKQTFEAVVGLIDLAEVDENDVTAESGLDKLFAELTKEDPDNLAAVEYRNFKKAAGKTLKSIIISVVARMESFMLSDIQYLTSTDDLHLESFADTKQALFVIIPTADTTFNFLVSLMYSQLFMTLYNYVETRVTYGWQAYVDQFNILKVEQAEDKTDSTRARAAIDKYIEQIKAGTFIRYNEAKDLYEICIKETEEVIAWRGEEDKAKELEEKIKRNIVAKNYAPDAARCPHHVRLILDEFANIGQIPDFNEKLATIRKYEMSCSIILQALSQLKKMYKDDWNTIVANCDSKLFLGCDDQETIKWLVEMLGKKTTTVENLSMQSMGNGSSSYNKSSRELLTIEQITMMHDDECVVRVRGERPYFGKKYELTEHPNYAYAHAHAGQFVIPVSGERGDSHVPLHKRREKLAESQKNIADGAEDGADIATAEDGRSTVEPQKSIKEELTSKVQAIDEEGEREAKKTGGEGKAEESPVVVTSTPLDKLKRSSKNTARKTKGEESARALENMDNGLSDDQASLIQSMFDSAGLTTTSSPAEMKEAAKSVVDLRVLSDDVDILFEETE